MKPTKLTYFEYWVQKMPSGWVLLYLLISAFGFVYGSICLLRDEHSDVLLTTAGLNLIYHIVVLIHWKRYNAGKQW